MLPVFIENDLEIPNGTVDRETLRNEAFLKSVQGEVKLLTGVDEPPSPDLTKKLLQKRRLLVIVDHLSEMNEETQKVIQPSNPRFPANALVVTSREEKPIGLAIKPHRLGVDSLVRFVRSYLSEKAKKEGEDEKKEKNSSYETKILEGCTRLTAMVEGRNLTTLLAC